MGPPKSGAILRDYHERTKHSPESVRRPGGGLDWSNVPSAYKEYLDLDSFPLPRIRSTGVTCHEAVERSASEDGADDLDLGGLSHLLFHAAGVVRTMRGWDFRAYASAGALYPLEAYVVADEVDGLSAGVYHYGPREHRLSMLRDGDFRGTLSIPGAAVVLIAGVPWRTAWKYEARGFRHLYWDAGMMVTNLLAASAANGIRSRVHLGFVDRDADGLLGLDGRSEFSLVAVAIGRGSPPLRIPADPLELRVAPISPHPLSFDEIENARQAVRLEGEGDVRRFVDAVTSGPSHAEDEALRIVPLPAEALSNDSFEKVVRRRGSSRQLARAAFPAAEFAAIADLALAGFAADWPIGSVELFIVANALEGVPPGLYRYRPGAGFAQLREGDFRSEAGFLCLEQRLGADASATCFLMADLEGALGRLGGRGYAAAQLEAAIATGRMYLEAYAQCLGASGITFYDDEIRRFLGTELEPMLAVVVGPEGHRASIQRCRERLTAQLANLPDPR